MPGLGIPLSRHAEVAMSLSARLEQDYLVAYKAKDTVRLGVLRLLKTALKNFQVQHLRVPEEGDVLDLIARQCKQRKESIDQFTAAGRLDLAEKEQAELVVLQGYMPEPLEGEALLAAVREAVAEAGAAGPKDMGKVMQILTAKYKGRYDGKAASEAVKAALASL